MQPDPRLLATSPKATLNGSTPQANAVPAAVVLPANVRATVGEPIFLQAMTAQPNVFFHVDPAEGLGVLPHEWYGPHDLIAVPQVAGVYHLVALVALPDMRLEQAVCRIDISDPEEKKEGFYELPREGWKTVLLLGSSILISIVATTLWLAFSTWAMKRR
jgi:hypothetical protein